MARQGLVRGEACLSNLRQPCAGRARGPTWPSHGEDDSPTRLSHRHLALARPSVSQGSHHHHPGTSFISRVCWRLREGRDFLDRSGSADMRLVCGGRQLLSRPLAQERNRRSDSQHSSFDAIDQVIVHKPVDGVNEMRPLPQRILAARTNPDLMGELDWTDRGGTTRRIEMTGHRSGQEDGGRAHQWGIGDLEVVVIERQRRATRRGQRPEPQALDGLRLRLRWAPGATGGPRGHETPLCVVSVVDLG